MRVLLELRSLSIAVLLFLLSCSPVFAQAPAPDLTCHPQTTEYEVSLRNRAEHLLHVRVGVQADNSGSSKFQLPVWNALYQIRDFAQYVREVTATNEFHQPLRVMKHDKTTWVVTTRPKGDCVFAEYAIYLDEAGPFGAQFNEEHAFLNWAQALMYPVETPANRIRIRLVNLPDKWKVRDATVFPQDDSQGKVAVDGEAPDYNSLVDSPVEVSAFTEAMFDEGGARYRVVVHGAAADYDMKLLTSTLRKLVAAETDWMQDRPYKEYVFLYHFPRGPAAGGMEHSYSTAIDVSAQRLQQNPTAFASVSAHEFFHLWNVKRIRPKTLEPIDYTKEMYTRALWFSEGVTSTVQEYMLVRAGLNKEVTFLANLAQQIAQLQERPAHLTQSVEESSLETWFDKYGAYRQPERSISYYNKGQIVGVLLDLRMREVSAGTKSLRDLFQYMNLNFAMRHQYFDDSDGVREAAQKVTGADFNDFFARYVAGKDEIPYDEFFRTVGMKLTRKTVKVPYAGFAMARNFGQGMMISRVEPDSQAQKAGLIAGDSIVSVNGQSVTDANSALAATDTGELVALKVRGRSGIHEIKLKMESREEPTYSFDDVEPVTPAQKARRAAWMRGDSEAPRAEAAH